MASASHLVLLEFGVPLPCDSFPAKVPSRSSQYHGELARKFPLACQKVPPSSPRVALPSHVYGPPEKANCSDALSDRRVACLLPMVVGPATRRMQRASAQV